MRAPRALALLALFLAAAAGAWWFVGHRAPSVGDAIVVYYTKADGTTLAPWHVTLGPARDRRSVAFYAVTQCLAGPSPETEAVRFPAGTRVRSVDVAGTTATVDLSLAAGTSPPEGSFAEVAEFKALVWTLTQPALDVASVSIRIDGAKVATLPGGHLELDEPLTRASFSAAALTLVLLALVAPAPARAQVPGPLWFQGSRLALDAAMPEAGDLAVSTRDAGLRRFLDRVGASLAFEPQSRYVVITAEDRRTIVFVVGETGFTAGGLRARAPFAPRSDGADVILPFLTLARALYVEPVADRGETVLQPRVGALDVRTEGARTVITVRAAMPLIVTTNAESADRLQVSLAGQGSSLAATRRAPGTALDTIDVSVGGSVRVPTTTLTLAGLPGTTHRIVAGTAPDTLTVVFEAAGTPSPVATAASATAADGSAAPAGPVAPVVAGRSTVTDIVITQTSDDGLSVRLSLSAAANFAWHRLLDHRWYLDLADTTLNGPGRDERPSFGAVQSVRVRQSGTSDAPLVRVAFTLAADQQIAIAPDADGITIVVTPLASNDPERVGYGRTGGPGVVPSAVGVASPDPFATGQPWKFGGSGAGSHVIVIDPGHGGGDTGTAHNGLIEKTITFDIAQRLRALLAAQGWTVRLTRDADIDPVSADNLARMRGDGKPNADDRAYLQTRCDVANAANARLFISIHVNSAPFSGARGTTFYWYKPQDAAFAQALERSVIPQAGTQDDGARHENFYVVRHTTMPAVLIETAFVTNPADVELLRQPAFLQNMAQGIANGVRAFAGAPSSSSVSAQ